MRLNKPNKDQAESGQAIVLVGLMMVVLFAFTGLAVDGGGLFFLYRDAQNATDAAVLAAAYAQCVDGDVTAAALQAADENGFDNLDDDIVTVREGASVILPAGVSLPLHVRDNLVQVQIDAEKPSYFIQVVYPGPLSVTSRSVAHCKKPFSFANVAGMLAMGECGNAINISGSSNRFDGSMHSNSDIKSTGSAHFISSGPVTVNDPGLVQGNVTYDPPEIEPATTSPDLIFEANNPLLIEYDLYREGGEVWNAIPEGYKHHITGNWSPQRTVLEGLYMVEGDIHVKNGVTYGPEGVTMIATGTIRFDSGDDAPVHFYNGVMNTTASGIQYPGLILASAYPRSDFTDKTGPTKCGNASDAIQFDGPSNNMRGIVYAPNMVIKVSAARNHFEGMLIAQSIQFSQSGLHIVVDKTLAPPRPPSVHYAE